MLLLTNIVSMTIAANTNMAANDELSGKIPGESPGKILGEISSEFSGEINASQGEHNELFSAPSTSLIPGKVVVPHGSKCMPKV